MYTTPILSGVNTRYGSNRWFAFSPCLKRDVYLFSDLEYDNWLLVEMNPSTKSFCEQPLEIQQEVHGQLRKSVFDMWALDKDGTETMIEVKYSCELDSSNRKYSARSARQVELQSKWCAEKGINYVVRNEVYIRSNQLLLSNLRALVCYMRQHREMNELDARRILDALGSQPQSLKELCMATGLQQSRTLEAVSWLYKAGSVGANFDRHPIGQMTEVWALA